MNLVTWDAIAIAVIQSGRYKDISGAYEMQRGHFIESHKTNAYWSKNRRAVGRIPHLTMPESPVVRDNTRTSNRQNRTISLTYIPATSGSLKSSDLCPSLVLLDFLSDRKSTRLNSS